MGTSTIKDYVEFLSQVAGRAKLKELKPDLDGLVSVTVDDEYVLNLQYVEQTSKILCFVEFSTLPKDAGREVYRELLVGALFGRETAGGFFAVEPESETLVYHYLFDFDPATADPAAFTSVLEKILLLVDIWAGRVRDLLQGETFSSSKSDDQMMADGRDFTRFDV